MRASARKREIAMGERCLPTPEMMLLLAGIGPSDNRPRSIKRCRKHVTRVRDTLAPCLPGVVTLPHLEAGRAQALWALGERCRNCAKCPGPQNPPLR